MIDFLKSIPHKFNNTDTNLLGKALDFARQAHLGQKRLSGEDYITHPIAAAVILGGIFPDSATIAATLLHDITEDTKVTAEELTKEFGEEIARLVDEVTKLGQVRLINSKDEVYLENLRKMFIATSSDIRVMLVKLADRLHNIRTIEFLPKNKQEKIAAETLEMYAPIAGRLGIGKWKDELEDLSFAVVDPKAFNETKKLLDKEIQDRQKGIKEMQKDVSAILRVEGVKFEDVSGRIKRVYSLHKKLEKYKGDISKIYDIVALRIVTKSTADCYAALGIIHKHFQPVPGRVKDFIATPKPNGYSSLHTTVFDKDGNVFEIQLRTDLMDEEAERGVAAHWFYSEHGKSDSLDRRTKFFKELHSWQEELGDSEDFLESLKIDFFRDRIFVLTPKGDVKDLPKGATVIDFAFAVHSDLGYCMTGAKINGKIAKIYDELQQGNVVEILRSKKPVKVSRDWLAACKTSNAKSKIRSYLNEHDKSVITRIRELKLQDIPLPKFFRKK